MNHGIKNIILITLVIAASVMNFFIGLHVTSLYKEVIIETYNEYLGSIQQYISDIEARIYEDINILVS